VNEQFESSDIHLFLSENGLSEADKKNF